jgi:hypothetical protein
MMDAPLSRIGYLCLVRKSGRNARLLPTPLAFANPISRWKPVQIDVAMARRVDRSCTSAGRRKFATPYYFCWCRYRNSLGSKPQHTAGCDECRLCCHAEADCLCVEITAWKRSSHSTISNAFSQYATCDGDRRHATYRCGKVTVLTLRRGALYCAVIYP